MELQADEDDILASLGLDKEHPPKDANDAFYDELAGGKFSKIDNMMLWVKSEISVYLHLQEHHIKHTKAVVEGGKAIDRPISRMELGRILVKYYLQAYHLPRFQKLNERAPCDFKVMIDKIVAYEPMRKVIENFAG